MIEQIVLENFLSFKKETKFEFKASMEKPRKGYEFIKWYEEINRTKLLKIQFLFGNNATGKTNFLKFLDIMRNLVCTRRTSKTSKESRIPDTYFKLSDDTINKPTKAEITFHVNQIKYVYGLSFGDNTIWDEKLQKYERTRKPVEVFHRIYDKDKGFTIVEFKSPAIDIEDQEKILDNVIQNTTVISIYDEKNIKSEDLKNVFNYFRHVTVIDKLEDFSLASMFANRKDPENLRKVLLPLLNDLGSNIIDYEVNTSSSKISEEESAIFKQILGEEIFNQRYPNGERKDVYIRFAHPSKTPEHKTWLNEDEESFGTRNMIRLIIILYDCSRNNSLIAIDEGATGIHQQTFGRIVQFFLGTSHNQFIMSSQQVAIMDMDGFRRDTVKFFDKDWNTGITSCEKIDLRKYHKNISIVNAYLNHSFGCLPEFPELPEWKKKIESYNEIMHFDET